jgi:hypothetical protein
MTQRCILGLRSEKHRGQGGSPEAQRPMRRKSLCTWIPEDLEAGGHLGDGPLSLPAQPYQSEPLWYQRLLNV